MDFHGGDGVAPGWLRGARAAGRASPANRVRERGVSHCYHGEAGAGQFYGGEDERNGTVQGLLIVGHHHSRARAIFHGDGSCVRAGGNAAGPGTDTGEPGGGTFEHLSDFVFRPTGLDPGRRGGVRTPVADRSVSRGPRRDAPCFVRSLAGMMQTECGRPRAQQRANTRGQWFS